MCVFVLALVCVPRASHHRADVCVQRLTEAMVALKDGRLQKVELKFG